MSKATDQGTVANSRVRLFDAAAVHSLTALLSDAVGAVTVLLEMTRPAPEPDHDDGSPPAGTTRSTVAKEMA